MSKYEIDALDNISLQYIKEKYEDEEFWTRRKLARAKNPSRIAELKAGIKYCIDVISYIEHRHKVLGI